MEKVESNIENEQSPRDKGYSRGHRRGMDEERAWWSKSIMPTREPDPDELEMNEAERIDFDKGFEEGKEAGKNEEREWQSAQQNKN